MKICASGIKILCRAHCHGHIASQGHIAQYYNELVNDV